MSFYSKFIKKIQNFVSSAKNRVLLHNLLKWIIFCILLLFLKFLLEKSDFFKHFENGLPMREKAETWSELYFVHAK